MVRSVVFVVALLLLGGSVLGQPTAFTYQGRLNDGGAAANGPHDFRFKLFDAATDGAQLGATLCFDGVNVIDGAFSVRLDFGQQFIATAPRHLEVLVRREIGQPCTDDFGYVLLTPRQAVTPTPTALHADSAFSLAAADGSPTDAVFVDPEGRVGIGTTTPEASGTSVKLNVTGGSILAANSGDQADLLWLASERSWVFRQEGIGSGAALKLQSIGGGGNKHFIVQTDGFVGIGTTTPSAKLDVRGDIAATSVQTGVVTTSRVNGALVIVDGANFNNAVIQGRNSLATSNGVGIFGATTSNSVFIQNMIGVHGSTASGSSTSFGVFSTGRLGATGTKSFRIDHPDDPATKYLYHYSAESPEVINFYRGTIMLDSRGTAIVQLPAYFAKINTRPSYQLTAVGAAMPMLHVSRKISEQSLSAGAIAGPGVAAPVCWFEIAGGVPGGEVSWRVEAVRNDEFVRRNGAPSEVDKPAGENGKLQAP